MLGLEAKQKEGMVMKARLSWLTLIAVVLIGSFLMLRQGILSSAQEGLAIPLPTAGPSPVLPTRAQPLEATLTTAQAAFERAVEYDQQMETVRTEPLALSANGIGEVVIPANVLVEEFDTRQNAAGVYKELGVYPVLADASEPVWVVFIDGEVDVVNMSAPWLREKIHNTLYVFSRRDGAILSVSYNIAFKPH